MNNKSALVQIMASHRSGDKAISESMVVYHTDPYMRHSASTSTPYNYLWEDKAYYLYGIQIFNQIGYVFIGCNIASLYL